MNKVLIYNQEQFDDWLKTVKDNYHASVMTQYVNKKPDHFPVVVTHDTFDDDWGTWLMVGMVYQEDFN